VLSQTSTRCEGATELVWFHGANKGALRTVMILHCGGGGGDYGLDDPGSESRQWLKI
jgi:hypothetical protein